MRTRAGEETKPGQRQPMQSLSPAQARALRLSREPARPSRATKRIYAGLHCSRFKCSISIVRERELAAPGAPDHTTRSLTAIRPRHENNYVPAMRHMEPA